MNENNDNNSDLTLQARSNDSESYEVNFFEENEDLYEVESSDEELADTQSLDVSEQIRPPFDLFSERGELVVNGGMEEFDCGVPEGWRATAQCAVSRVTAPGRVHSGESCVGLSDCVKLRQVIFTGIHAFRFYELSFCAQLQGTTAGLACEVTFLRGHHEIAGGSIFIRCHDIPNTPRQFGNYSFITSQAPRGVTGLVIEFSVNTNGCQCVGIDDVSCREQ